MSVVVAWRFTPTVTIEVWRTDDDGWMARCAFLDGDPGITAARMADREEAVRICKSAVFTAIGHLTKFREATFLSGVAFEVVDVASPNPIDPRAPRRRLT